jgi:hypothetical protein
MRKYVQVFCSLMLVCFGVSCVLQARVVIPGNAPNQTSTFAIPVNNFVALSDGVIITTAADVGAGTFSVAQFNRITNVFDGMASEQIALNGVANATNPLFNVAIAHAAQLQQDKSLGVLLAPVVAVPSSAPGTAYFFETPTSLLSCLTINDAQGNPTAGIIRMTGSAISRVFAAVLPQTGAFGQPGSGITALGIKENTQTVDGKESTYPTLIALTQAEALDTTTPAVALGGPLTSLTQPISLWWDTEWALRGDERFRVVPEPVYCGVGDIVSGPNATDGACSVLLGVNGIAGKILTLVPIFSPLANFAGVGTDAIIIATGAAVELSVHHLRTMWTSTDLRYLIVVGGNGAPDDTDNTVYALPLIATGIQEGILASQNDITQPALLASDLVTSTNPAALVGGGPLAAGTISHISVQNDLVCAVVSEGFNQGVYASQPIFAANGTITAWTTWHNIISAPASVFDASLMLADGNWFLLTSNDPLGANLPNTITTTQWGAGDPASFGPAIVQLDQLFTQNNGGVEGLANFNANIPGLSSTALLAAYGVSTLALVETGIQDVDGIYTPTAPQTFANIQVYNNSIVSTPPTDQTILAFTGGVLGDIGTLTSFAIGHDAISSDSWLFAGGVNGLAVLAQPTTLTGWGNSLGNNFAGITAGMTFVQLGNYSSIKKLVADGNYLYVLTGAGLDRINLSVSLLSPQITTIATATMLSGLSAYDVFTDCVISGTLGLLATSKGVYCTANGTNVTDAQPSWTYMSLPEQELPTTRFFAVTTTGNEADLAQGSGGNLYVVSGNETHDRTVVNRLVIAGLNGAPVSATTVQIFTADTYMPGTVSYCLNYGRTQNMFALDGALTYAVQNSGLLAESSLFLPLAGYPLRSTKRFVGIRAKNIPNATAGGVLTSSLIQQNVSGAWMLGARQGVRINE